MPRSEPTHIPTLDRLRSLDGLRGVAAFVVLAHHSLLLLPGFSATYQGGPTPAVGSTIWWLSYSPLKWLSAGGEAVIVFFVLSGLVVTLPVLRSNTFNWLAYFPQRVLRLMLPILGSIAVAGTLIVLVPQRPIRTAGTWLFNYSTPDPTLSQIVSAANLFGNNSNFHVNNPLWSLRWEFVFSLGLPIFVLLAVVARRHWIAATIAVFLLTFCGRALNFEPLVFLPTFFLGALIAVNLEGLRRLFSRVNANSFRHLVWASFTALGSLLLIGFWLTGPLPSGMRWISLVFTSFTPIAACMIVLACLGWRVLDRFLLTELCQFAGKISFSLYLTHVPVLIFSSYLLQGQPLPFVIVTGGCLAVLVSMVFHWIWESRCHRVSRMVGRWAGEKMISYRSTEIA